MITNRGFRVILFEAWFTVLALLFASNAAFAQNLSWNDVSNLSVAEQTTRHPKIALSSGGLKVVAIWLRSNGSNDILQSRTAEISGNTVDWGPVIDLSTAGQDADDPQMALSSDGTKVTAIWERDDGSDIIIQSRTAEISGNTANWGSLVNDLSAVGHRPAAPKSSCRRTVQKRRRYGGDMMAQNISSRAVLHSPKLNAS